jgi:hypothetical protein
MDMKVTLVYGSGVEPFTKDATFSLDEDTHVIKFGNTNYPPDSGMFSGESALNHYTIPENTNRHGIGITGSGSALRVVGVVPVDPTRDIQATGMWVAEPPKP